MRYDPKRRRKFPSSEDWRAWLALDRIGKPYDKIPFINDSASHTENWYMLARVWFDGERYGYLEWGGHDYLKSHGNNAPTRQARARRLAWLDEQGIPYLLLRRRDDAYAHEIMIRRWIDKEMKR